MIDRNDVERWFSYAQENIRHFGPREGSAIPAEALAELCRAWLALDSAPVVEVTECNQLEGTVDFDHGDMLAAVAPLQIGQRVRIVPYGEGE